METIYIKFKSPSNIYKTKNDGVVKRLIKRITVDLLKKILPQANPDFDSKIDNVEYWLVEFDSLNGIPQREIGLDSKEKPIMKMPWNDNYGYWTDNNLKLDDFKKQFKTSEINANLFEEFWTMNIY